MTQMTGQVVRFFFAILLIVTSAMLVLPSMTQAYSVHGMAMSDCDACPDHAHDMGDATEHGMACSKGHCGLFNAMVLNVETWSSEPIAIAHPKQVAPIWQSLRSISDLPPPRM
ncbi:hypothetical protein [Marivivens donghaensis]|uniref:hypothetical protein n=1 Tax=Marivivens donghaensis TaxID=1699413 RepID=UPI003F6A0673